MYINGYITYYINYVFWYIIYGPISLIRCKLSKLLENVSVTLLITSMRGNNVYHILRHVHIMLEHTSLYTQCYKLFNYNHYDACVIQGHVHVNYKF